MQAELEDEKRKRIETQERLYEKSRQHQKLQDLYDSLRGKTISSSSGSSSASPASSTTSSSSSSNGSLRNIRTRPVQFPTQSYNNQSLNFTRPTGVNPIILSTAGGLPLSSTMATPYSTSPYPIPRSAGPNQFARLADLEDNNRKVNNSSLKSNMNEGAVQNKSAMIDSQLYQSSNSSKTNVVNIIENNNTNNNNNNFNRSGNEKSLLGPEAFSAFKVVSERKNATMPPTSQSISTSSSTNTTTTIPVTTTQRPRSTTVTDNCNNNNNNIGNVKSSYRDSFHTPVQFQDK